MFRFDVGVEPAEMGLIALFRRVNSILMITASPYLSVVSFLVRQPSSAAAKQLIRELAFLIRAQVWLQVLQYMFPSHD